MLTVAAGAELSPRYLIASTLKERGTNHQMTCITLERSNFYDVKHSTFGDRLAAARQSRGLDQKDLAQRLGVSLKTVDAWELDRTEPASNRLQMLAGLLNVSIVWLLTGKGEGIPEPLDPDADSTGVRVVAQEIVNLKDDLIAATARLAQIETEIRRLL